MELEAAHQRIKPDLEINITTGDHHKVWLEVYTRNGLILAMNKLSASSSAFSEYSPYWMKKIDQRLQKDAHAMISRNGRR